jgi:hypothetical protein
MRELEVREDEERQSVLQGKTKKLTINLMIGTVNVATLRWLLERRA